MKNHERRLFEELDDQDQAKVRRFIDCFMLASGIDIPLPDDKLPEMFYYLHRALYYRLTNKTGMTDEDLLNGTIDPDYQDSVGWQCTLMIVINIVLAGRATTRQMLTQALANLDDLDALGNMLLAAARQSLRQSTH